MPRIEDLTAREILDSRGRPTVLACCRLADGCEAFASVPAGASTGTAEAWELRDRDISRYGGLGCRRAVSTIEGSLRDALCGQLFDTQSDLDNAMIRLDGTRNKSKLGANSILAVSIAFARAHAKTIGSPLCQHLGKLLGATPNALPRLTINLFSGGKHAGQQVAVQDVLIIPFAPTIDRILSTAYDVLSSRRTVNTETLRYAPAEWPVRPWPGLPRT